MSAAPLLLVAGAIVAVSVARPAGGRRAVMRFVAALAFTAWGLAQLFPDSGAAGLLNDLAILLFVVEAGCAVISDAGVVRLSRLPGMSSTAVGKRGTARRSAQASAVAGNVSSRRPARAGCCCCGASPRAL